MSRAVCAVLALSMIFLGGCASTHNAPKYAWGNYESALYNYYKAPANAADYMTALQALISDADARQQKVPPGIYAEYGYLLMLQRRCDEAIQYFVREKNAWPEAGAFMETMIKVAQNDLNQKNNKTEVAQP